MRHGLAKLGTHVSTPDFDTITIVNDKGLLLHHLCRYGVDVGPYYIYPFEGTVESILCDLQYPAKRVVIKPRRGAGSRGIYIFDSSISVYQSKVPDRDCGTGDLRVFLNRYPQINLSDYLFMPHYDGPVYDVDVVTKNGKVVAISQRRREYLNPLSPTNEGCVLENNPNILKYIEKIVDILGLDGAADFDVVLAENGMPVLLDASARMSGSVGAAVEAGINIPSILVSSVLGLSVPPDFFNPRYGTRIRPFMTLAEV
jgi:carbamoyl-phosphate synthase large subunit